MPSRPNPLPHQAAARLPNYCRAQYAKRIAPHGCHGVYIGRQGRGKPNPVLAACHPHRGWPPSGAIKLLRLTSLLFGLFSGHFRRDLVPAARELRPRPCSARFGTISGCGGRGARRRGATMLAEARYAIVIFVLLPAMVLTGLTMSPAVTVAAPFLFDLQRLLATSRELLTANQHLKTSTFQPAAALHCLRPNRRRSATPSAIAPRFGGGRVRRARATPAFVARFRRCCVTSWQQRPACSA